MKIRYVLEREGTYLFTWKVAWRSDRIERCYFSPDSPLYFSSREDALGVKKRLPVETTLLEVVLD